MHSRALAIACELEVLGSNSIRSGEHSVCLGVPCVNFSAHRMRLMARRIRPCARLSDLARFAGSRSRRACSLSSAGSLMSSLPVPRQATFAGLKFGQREPFPGTSRQWRRDSPKSV